MITEAGNKIAAESHFQSLVIGGETESECTKKLAVQKNAGNSNYVEPQRRSAAAMEIMNTIRPHSVANVWP